MALLLPRSQLRDLIISGWRYSIGFVGRCFSPRLALSGVLPRVSLSLFVSYCELLFPSTAPSARHLVHSRLFGLVRPHCHVASGCVPFLLPSPRFLLLPLTHLVATFGLRAASFVTSLGFGSFPTVGAPLAHSLWPRLLPFPRPSPPVSSRYCGLSPLAHLPSLLSCVSLLAPPLPSSVFMVAERQHSTLAPCPLDSYWDVSARRGTGICWSFFSVHHLTRPPLVLCLLSFFVLRIFARITFFPFCVVPTCRHFSASVSPLRSCALRVQHGCALPFPHLTHPRVVFPSAFPSLVSRPFPCARVLHVFAACLIPAPFFLVLGAASFILHPSSRGRRVLSISPRSPLLRYFPPSPFSYSALWPFIPFLLFDSLFSPPPLELLLVLRLLLLAVGFPFVLPCLYLLLSSLSDFWRFFRYFSVRFSSVQLRLGWFVSTPSPLRDVSALCLFSRYPWCVTRFFSSLSAVRSSRHLSSGLRPFFPLRCSSASAFLLCLLLGGGLFPTVLLGVLLALSFTCSTRWFLLPPLSCLLRFPFAVSLASPPLFSPFCSFLPGSLQVLSLPVPVAVVPLWPPCFFRFSRSFSRSLCFPRLWLCAFPCILLDRSFCS